MADEQPEFDLKFPCLLSLLLQQTDRCNGPHAFERLYSNEAIREFADLAVDNSLLQIEFLADSTLCLQTSGPPLS